MIKRLFLILFESNVIITIFTVAVVMLLAEISILLITTSGYAQTTTVERVIDGDTIKLTNGLARV